MKKLLCIALATVSLSGFAQVKVDSLSRLIVGSPEKTQSSADLVFPFQQSSNEPGVVTGNSPVATDPKAKICVLGEENVFKSGGYIAFGNGKNVTVGEVKALSSSYDTDILELRGTGGIRFRGNGDALVAYYSGNKFQFKTDVTVDGVFINSDSRLKKDINEITGLTAVLADVTPVSYTLSRPAAQKLNSDTESESIAMADADSRERFGFIAQEVQKVFPQLVTEDENGYLAVDYIGFIPILVEAVNTLSARVDQQQQTIAALTNTQRKAPGAAGTDPLSDIVASMSQNRPNPFTDSTVIECTLPESVNDADILVYDLQGKQLMRIPVGERGTVAFTIEGRTLSPGMYIYTLIADGQEIASRRMILTD